MNWLKITLLRFLKNFVVELVQAALQTAASDLYNEINSSFEDKNQRETIKSGIDLLRSKVSVEIQERIERL